MFTQSKLTVIRDALLTLNIPVYHYTAPSEHNVPYIIWYEEAEASAIQAENHKAEQALSGYVEFFTLTEYDELIDDIQDALNGIDGLSFRYDSIIYGDPQYDNNIIHHAWYWEMM